MTMSLGTSYSPTVPWEGPQVKNFDQCLHIVTVIWKCTDIFRGIYWLWGVYKKGYVVGTFLGGIRREGRKFS